MEKHFATSQEVMEYATRVRINSAIKLLNNAGGFEEGAKRNPKFAQVLAEMCPAGGIVINYTDEDPCVIPTDSHSIAYACTGAGKTRREILPLMYSDILSCTNMVVNDIKGELLRETKDLLALMNYHVYVLDLRNASASHHFNPLDLAWLA